MRVCYLIQTHKDPNQVCRLISTIKAASPTCFILISHDYTHCDFPATQLQSFSEIALIPKTVKGIRGDFSLVQAHLDAISWLLENQIHFDWLINLSGQDYPIRSPAQFEAMLGTATDDGFFEYFDILSSDSPLGIREGMDRYFYQYWRSKFQLNRFQKLVLKPIKTLINISQPWVRANLVYGLSIGLKASNPPFNPEFRCYGGSFFKALSKKAVIHLDQYLKEQPNLIAYYVNTRQPDESFFQTVLLNLSELKFSNYQWMYTDFSGTKAGHPRTLNQDDYPKLIQSEAYFARKFYSKNCEIFAQLDRHIFDASVQGKRI